MAAYRKPTPYRSHTPYRSSGAVTQTILLGGIAPPPDSGPAVDRQVPTPGIDYRNRTLLPTGVAPGVVGSQDVSHYTRFIDEAGLGYFGETIGATRVEFLLRTIDVPFIASNIFGLANIARIQIVQPSGFTDEFVSSNHEFDINLQRILVATGSADQAHYGTALVRNQFEVLRFTGWQSDGFQVPIIYNKKQQIFVSEYEDTTGDPTQWPQYAPFVENKIKEIKPFGWISHKFSFFAADLVNNARAVITSGWDSNVYGAGTFIAYKNRAVLVEGWDSFYNTQYTVIYNNARVLHPVGWQEENVPLGATLLNLNRTITQVFSYGGPIVGTAYIDYAIRTIHCGPYNDVTQFIPLPEVRLNPFPIKPLGIAIPPTTAPTVFIHFNQFFPSSANVHTVPWVGEPFIANKNRKLLVFPSDQAIYGLTRIFNKKQILPAVGGGFSQIFGATDISRRTKVLNPAPFNATTVSTFDQIRNVLPDPPSTQRFYPPGIDDTIGAIPAPLFHYATIFNTGIFDETFGTLKLTRNTIQMLRGIFNLEQVGEPFFIGPRYVFAKSFPDPDFIAGGGDSDTFPSKPRFSPHHIYAPSGDQASAAYKSNNPTSGGIPSRIDENLINEDSGGTAWPFFSPYATVTNKNRSLSVQGTDFDAPFGHPSVSLKNRTIHPLPMLLTRYGFTVFLNVPQYVNLNELSFGIPPGTFGDAAVAPPPDPNYHANPIGLAPGVIGTASIELFNREIQIPGIPQRGNPDQGLTNPWGLPIIGYPRVYAFGGYDFTLWGNAIIDFKNRVRGPFGGFQSDTFQDEDISSFSDRMRVTRRNGTDHIPGIAPGPGPGTPTFTFKNRVIYGRPIVEYTVPACALALVIYPSGWLDETIGDIDKWEAGKIKPHGDALDSYGTPKLLRRLIPAGVAAGGVGSAYVVPSIGVSGMGGTSFDPGPLISGGFDCHGSFFRPFGFQEEAIGTANVAIESDGDPGGGHL